MIPKPSQPKSKKKIEPEKISKFIEITNESKIQMKRVANGSSSIYLFEKKNTLPEIKVTTILKLILILSKIKVKQKGIPDKEKSSISKIIVSLKHKNK